MQIAAVRLTEGVNEAICTRWLSCLPRKRQEEILRRQRPQARERSLSGEILARAMLARELRCPLRDVPICRETHGKPVLKDCTNLFFNISHSGNYAVCAVSKQPVGIDIERIGAYQPNVARRVCSDAEQKLLEQCEDPARLFYRLWTLKESYVKLTGTGISVPLSQITFSFLADGRVESNQNRVQFASFPFGDGYWLAVGEKMR